MVCISLSCLSYRPYSIAQAYNLEPTAKRVPIEGGIILSEQRIAMKNKQPEPVRQREVICEPRSRRLGIAPIEVLGNNPPDRCLCAQTAKRKHNTKSKDQR